MDRESRDQRLRETLQNRIMILDGAMGTSIQAHDLSANDFGGSEYEGCNEYLNILKPELIKDIHLDYFQAGADIAETNSFGSTPIVLDEYGLGAQAFEISRRSAEIAREAAEVSSTDEKLCFVAGSMGPTTKAISVTGGITWDGLVENFRIQASGLIAGGVDLLLIETSQDTLNIKAALEGIDRAFSEINTFVPVAVQVTIETMGTMLGGQDIESIYRSIAHRDLLWIGMNCATGPEFMRDHIRTLARISRFPISVVPNAGLPDEDGKYNETPEKMATTMSDYMDSGWINVVGGCCGTVGEHIHQLAEHASKKHIYVPDGEQESAVVGLETQLINDENRPLIVGERTNVLGSREFKRLIADGRIEEAAEIGRRQVRAGAHILDVCLQDPDRDEMNDISTFLEELTRKIKAPIMLDSTDARVLEEALKRTPGKSIINSINLEDGEDRFRAVIPLAKRYGAALVVGCIDDDKEQAQAITKDRKIEIARRSYNLLTQKYGVEPQDIIFDPLVFPVGTGDQNYVGSGVETLESIMEIKKEFPKAKTILGVSNVSFGLPAAGREVLNSVMLYHAVQAGLDMAIVNSQRIERYASLSDQEKKLSEDLIWWRGTDPIGAFADYFRERKTQSNESDRKALPLDERLASNVVEGTKEGLLEDLDEALRSRKPLEIINGPLMNGMSEVGRLFGNNELIVAEVLESAEVMKSAVSHLEPHMESLEESSRGRVLLATVKGDVHDIGKNLVDIIFSNNGYQVINLGIKIPPQELIQAYNDHEPDVIGLSGLLVKSAQMMVDTARDFREANIDVPLLVGGAALTNRFTRLRISPEYAGLVVYAQDAMTGLDLVGKIRDDESRAALANTLEEETLRLNKNESVRELKSEDQIVSGSTLEPAAKVPVPPDLIQHILTDYDLSEVFSYINPTMLYNRHLGFRGSRFSEALENREKKAMDLHEKVQSVEDYMLSRPDIQARAIYRFFRAGSEGNDICILSPDGETVLEKFTFERQSTGEGLCLADYLHPIATGETDYIGMFVTTVGPGVRALAEEWKDRGDYLGSHIMQILALEGAEGFAELLHQRMRAMWGMPDQSDISKQDLFKSAYTGRRFSFGYPACPRLDDQAGMWRLLQPEKEIGVELTEEFMMDPEGSVSALVIHHPQAKYFSVNSALA
ncbi:MAG: methionine synthase [SAR202 cluster bacterium]|nr:methionine synthase [SAR202 cluster bacterium]|tara:strand:+ start:9184 stop:12657 length:3474 start_codon:yes stop_codon:yes gene_type:complete